MQIQQNVALAPHTTFKIGGPARFFVEAKTVDEVVEALNYAKQNKLKIFVLGGASNILFSDQGFDGLVIKLKIENCELKIDRLICGAGADLQEAVDMAIAHSLAGLEWAGGLPGTVGGAVRGNAGAFGGEIKDIVESIKVIDQNGHIKTYTNSQCQFGYRDSIFKQNGEIVAEVTLRLTPGVPGRLRAVANEHVEYRKQRHPLEYGNAGSVFKNIPVKDLPKDLVEKWREVIKQDPFPIVPTARIIADAGLAGHTIGQAQVSTKHTNYIVNLGGASSEDVKKLIAHVKKIVKEEFGIDLEEEVQIVERYHGSNHG